MNGARTTNGTRRMRKAVFAAFAAAGLCLLPVSLTSQQRQSNPRPAAPPRYSAPRQQNPRPQAPRQQNQGRPAQQYPNRPPPLSIRPAGTAVSQQAFAAVPTLSRACRTAAASHDQSLRTASRRSRSLPEPGLQRPRLYPAGSPRHCATALCAAGSPWRVA